MTETVQKQSKSITERARKVTEELEGVSKYSVYAHTIHKFADLIVELSEKVESLESITRDHEDNLTDLVKAVFGDAAGCERTKIFIDSLLNEINKR